jgi:hypothetical protein
VFALASFAGCLSDLTPDPAWVIDGPPTSTAAIALIEERLGGDDYLPVVWYGADAIASCPQTSGSPTNDQDFESPDGCVSGITGANLSIVGWNGVDGAAWTSLTHELAHQRFGDGGHTIGAIWGDHGRDNYVRGTVVGDINLELLELGL